MYQPDIPLSTLLEETLSGFDKYSCIVASKSPRPPSGNLRIHLGAFSEASSEFLKVIVTAIVMVTVKVISNIS